MQNKFKIFSLIITFSFLVFVASPSLVFAHQPRITQSQITTVPDPEISKAYYGELSGEPDTYVIESVKDFDLYVGILVPDIKNPKKDVTAVIKKGEKVLATLGGENAEWKKFFEPFGQSTYFDGGEYKLRAEAGTYTVVVTSVNNDSKYSLAIGEIEAFDRAEGINALNLIPELKRDFFEESPISFIKSPFGWGLIVAMYILAGIVGFTFRAILIKFASGSLHGKACNIGKYDRVIRLILGIGLLIFAVLTTWNPVVIFFSGFSIFEALFSWCGLYAVIGKSTSSKKL